MYWTKLNSCPEIDAHWCLTQNTWLYSWILFYVLCNLSLQLGRFCCFWFGGLIRVCVVSFLRCSSCLRVRLQIPPKINHSFFWQGSQYSGCGLSAEVKHLVHMHKAMGSTLSTTQKKLSVKSPISTKHLDDNTSWKLDIISIYTAVNTVLTALLVFYSAIFAEILGRENANHCLIVENSIACYWI